jgi:hypothetical protein
MRKILELTRIVQEGQDSKTDDEIFLMAQKEHIAGNLKLTNNSHIMAVYEKSKEGGKLG